MQSGDVKLQPAPVPPGPRDDPRRLLAVSADGQFAVFTANWDDGGAMSLVSSDGSTTTLDLTKVDEGGSGAAAFAPDGTWLAVVDGAGELWRVDVKSAVATKLMSSANGMSFGVWLRFNGPDELIVNLVGSVEVPFPMHVAALDLNKMSATFLTVDGWEWAGWPQTDGSLLYASVLPDGGALQLNRLDVDGSVDVGADLGIVKWIDVNGSGFAAYSTPEGNVILRTPAGELMDLSAGAVPRFSPDGSQLAIAVEGGTAVKSFDLAGVLLGEAQGPYASWATCDGRCAP